MIHSMTAFGSARADVAQGTLALEIRSVNSRFLDLYFKLPEELRHVESALREMLSAELARGKIEVRASFVRQDRNDAVQLDPQWLADLAKNYAAAREVLPDLAPPRMVELMNWPGQRNVEAFDSEAWGLACLNAARQALGELQAARAREGARLAQVMLDCAAQASGIVAEVEQHLPVMLAEHRAKLASKLHDTVCAAFPSGFTHISGAELSERIAQEATLFALRIDVAEELARLRSHFQELKLILGKPPASDAADMAIPGAEGAPASGTKRTPAKRKTGTAGSAGKRLDFLLQEMNREANTLGSKAGSLSMTTGAIDLKLLVEQMREQAQNLE